MKKLLLLSALLIFACSSDDSDNTNCPDQPIINTLEVSEINYDIDTDRASAVFSAEIQNIQLGANCETISVTTQGFVYGTNIQPQTGGSNNWYYGITVPVNGQTPSFTLDNIYPETTIYVRAFLTNVIGTFYGNEVSFTTPPSAAPLYLDENGITIKARPWVDYGDVGTVDGVEYTVVDRAMLYEMLNSGNPNVCTTKMTDFSYLLSFADLGDLFNVPMNNWDTSNVTNMGEMFSTNNEFNQDISNWDTSNVTQMWIMFRNATAFNQDISNWDVSNVINCDYFSDNTPQWTLPQPNFTNCTP